MLAHFDQGGGLEQQWDDQADYVLRQREQHRSMLPKLGESAASLSWSGSHFNLFDNGSMCRSLSNHF